MIHCQHQRSLLLPGRKCLSEGAVMLEGGWPRFWNATVLNTNTNMKEDLWAAKTLPLNEDELFLRFVTVILNKAETFHHTGWTQLCSINSIFINPITRHVPLFSLTPNCTSRVTLKPSFFKNKTYKHSDHLPSYYTKSHFHLSRITRREFLIQGYPNSNYQHSQRFLFWLTSYRSISFMDKNYGQPEVALGIFLKGSPLHKQAINNPWPKSESQCQERLPSPCSKAGSSSSIMYSISASSSGMSHWAMT